ncbi:MAG: serine acetyltransferase [Armatimonadetes bacterium]|nr:serine acetyltransferase [Armatimonadota bacterium]
MTVSELRYLWYTDLHRYGGGTSFRTHLKAMRYEPGYRCSYHYRLAVYLGQSRNPLAIVARKLHALVREHYMYKYGIRVPPETKVGRGLYIGHFSGLIVAPNVVLGDNCSLSQGVTLGFKPSGAYAGNPVVGNNVYIAPGAKIIGAVTLGDGVVVGANAVVTRDVAPGCVVAGVPARVLSTEADPVYVGNTDYLDYEAWRAARRS